MMVSTILEITLTLQSIDGKYEILSIKLLAHSDNQVSVAKNSSKL